MKAGGGGAGGTLSAHESCWIMVRVARRDSDAGHQQHSRKGVCVCMCVCVWMGGCRDGWVGGFEMHGWMCV